MAFIRALEVLIKDPIGALEVLMKPLKGFIWALQGLLQALENLIKAL